MDHGGFEIDPFPNATRMRTLTMANKEKLDNERYDKAIAKIRGRIEDAVARSCFEVCVNLEVDDVSCSKEVIKRLRNFLSPLGYSTKEVWLERGEWYIDQHLRVRW